MATSPDLFKDVRFYAIGDLHENVEKLLENGGAKKESYLSSIVTHAITTDFDSTDVEEAQDCWQVPTVTERWVELSSDCKTLLPTEAFTPSTAQLFSGLVFCPSQLSTKDKDLVWGCATFYGGSCQLFLNDKCTHLIVSKPEGAKYEAAMNHPDIITIVTPDWVLDSVNSKKLEDAVKYHPTLVMQPKPATQSSIPETQISQQDIISSSLQSIALNKTVEGGEANTAELSTATPTSLDTRHEMTSATTATVSTMTQRVVNRTTPSQQTIIVSQPQNPMIPSVAMNEQTVISQGGQQYLITGQNPGQTQAMVMQQFPMQRQGSVQQQRMTAPIMQQRFQTATSQGQTDPRQTTPNQKKPKRRRASAKSKAKAANNPVANTPMHGNQMTMMPQQQFMQQQNQQMLMNPHRMSMMHQQPGQPGKMNYMPQQQLYQPQHFQANMQGKPQVSSTSPQKQHLIGDQTGMRQFMPGTYQQGNMMRMQQTHQPRQNQVNPQMMQMSYNPQIQQQLAQQQMKMTAPNQQQRPQMGIQQQPMMMAQGISMQNQMQGMNASVKMQPRMQVPAQQQQGMLVQQQQQVSKDGLSPQQMPMTAQQQSPLKQPVQVLQQQNMTQQQRQHMMQQMHQRQMHLQQQQQQQQQSHMMQTPGSMPTTVQKHVSPVTSHASINVGGMGVISPTALQQGLMMAQAQQNSTFQQPLIHPSLQTPQDYGKGGSTKSRRSKSRKTKDGDENSEGKTKPKSRSRPRKSSQSPATSSPGSKKLTQVSPGMGTVAGYYQPSMNILTPSTHPTVPLDFAGNKHMFATPNASAGSLAATENTFGQTPRMISQESSKVETRFLNQPARTPTPPPPPRGPFIDPLESYPMSFRGKYHGHDPAENVPQDLCLLGCVFVITEYQDTVPDIKIIEHWKRIINKFGGIVEEHYNTCTCTHILCISQTTSLFKNALLEGKRCVTVYWLNDVLLVRKLQPPWLAIHIPTPFATSQKPATKHAISYTGFHQKERERIRMMASVCGCTISGCLSRSNTVLICKGTQSVKYDKAREWKISCVNVHWLRDILLGDALAVSDSNQSKYQVFNESAPDLFSLMESRVQKILDSWKVPVRVTLDCMQRARVKRKNSIAESSLPAVKRARIEGSYQSLPRVCFTGLPIKQVTELQKILESLQGQVSKSVSLSTHLVAERVSRTVKFLCAVSACQYIVTPKWIEESAKSNWLLEEDKYLLKDKVAEEKFEFSLEDSLRKARSKPLFKGYIFCITENVVPDRKILTEIVECAGGKVIQKIPTVPMLKRLKLRQPPNNHVLLVSCPADKHLVIKWKQEGIPVHNAEIILSGVLKQEVNEMLYQL